MKNSIRAVMVTVILAAVAALSACILGGESSQNEVEPNDSTSQATDLGTLGSTTVYAELSGDDTTDCFHFSKDSESIVEFDIVTGGTGWDYDIEYTLTGGASPVSGSSAEYKYISGQAAYRNYDLTVLLDSYGSGGKYVVLIRCR